MNELRCIHWWRLTPRQWQQETVDSRARMMAYMHFRTTCDAYRDEWKEDRREKKKRGDEASFSAMRQRMGLE